MVHSRSTGAVSVALVACGLSAGVASAMQAAGEARLVDRIDTLVELAVEQDAIPGLAMVIGVGPDVLFAKGWGFLGDGRRYPVGPETVFRVGALSDQWINAAVLRLVDAGRLALADEVQEHLPGWDWGEEVVTLDHLFVALDDETVRVTFIVEDGPAHSFMLDEGGFHSLATRVE